MFFKPKNSTQQKIANFKNDFQYFLDNEWEDTFLLSWKTQTGHILQMSGFYKNPNIFIWPDKAIWDGQPLWGLCIPIPCNWAMEYDVAKELGLREIKLRFVKSLAYVRTNQ